MRRSSLQRKILLLLLVLVLAVCCLYPFESTVVPTRSALVVTQGWKPIQNVAVRQIWQHYSLEGKSHEEDLRTDSNGRVTFPRRAVRASLLRRILHPVWNVITQGIHASFGVHTDMFPVGAVTQNQVGEGTVQARPGDVVFPLREP